MKTQVNYLNAVRALIGENRQLLNDWLLEYYQSSRHNSAKSAS
jgi:hypothetical protein